MLFLQGSLAANHRPRLGMTCYVLCDARISSAVQAMTA
jgi:hypothetical protein